MNFSQKITNARTALDEHVRDIVEWHFSPETGCSFWLEFAENLDFDPKKEIGGYADLKCLGHFQDEWLRGGPVRRWVPKAYANEPIYVLKRVVQQVSLSPELASAIFTLTTNSSVKRFQMKVFRPVAIG